MTETELQNFCQEIQKELKTVELDLATNQLLLEVARKQMSEEPKPSNIKMRLLKGGAFLLSPFKTAFDSMMDQVDRPEYYFMERTKTKLQKTIKKSLDIPDNQGTKGLLMSLINLLADMDSLAKNEKLVDYQDSCLEVAKQARAEIQRIRPKISDEKMENIKAQLHSALEQAINPQSEEVKDEIRTMDSDVHGKEVFLSQPSA